MEVPMRPRRRSRRREYGSREQLTEVCRAHARRLGLVGQAMPHFWSFPSTCWFSWCSRGSGGRAGVRARERDLRLEYTHVVVSV